MTPVISIENISKSYHLGVIGSGTFSDDFKMWWAQVRGKPNPLLRIGERDHGNRSGEEIWALRDISFSVEQGEVLGIIGRNGAGKSTLLKILSRVTAPTSGLIKVKGRIASLLEVGTGFNPDLTGRENVYLNGAILGMTKEEVTRKMDEIVDFSGIEQFIETPVKRYSSGMYVRLAFAVAAHLDPEILVLDEVLAVGDAEFQKKCLGKMGDVAKEGRTVLFVSHNMGAISELCPRCILLEAGKILMDAPVQEVIPQYLKSGLYQGSDWQRKDMAVPETINHYLKSLNILNTERKFSNKFLYGERISISCTVFSKKSEEIFLGIGIRDSLSRQIIHFNSKDQNLKLIAKPGTNRFSVNFENILNKGDYYVTVWIGDSHFLSQDYIKDCISFSSDTVNLGNSYYNGIVITRSDWAQETDFSEQPGN